MGKKGTKRKTTWRTLSLSESVDDATSLTNGSTAPNSEEATSKDNKYPSSSYLRRKPLFNSSSNVRNDNRGDHPRSYYKQNSTLSSSSSYSSRNSYHRRPFQNNGSRFFSYRTGRAQSYRSFDANKENNQGKPHFNEEEYTRITTPRQDVIFKKGYLSQPRKYFCSTDTNTTSSAAASIVSTEESISAASVPSLSPEQCSSYADSVDPEQAFMYSCFDQNGILYINPCLPNGFDQYSGQMFMLPYSYQPYSVYPPDLNSPMQSTDVEEIPTSTDSNENLSDKETNIKETTDKMENNCDSKPEPSESEKTTADTEENAESTAGDTEQVEVTNSTFQNFYNCGYQPYYPPVFFPYVYGQQFVPLMPEAGDYQPCDESSDEGVEEDNCSKKEDGGMQTNSDENSSGATTTDCSKEDCNNTVDNACLTVVDATSCDTAVELKPASNQETETKIVFNADAEEFIPRLHKSRLNVNVKEFLPSNYTSTESAASSSENDSFSANVETKEDALVKLSVSETEEKGFRVEPPKEQRKSAVKKNQTNLSPSENVKEENKLTLAERIKKEMAREIIHSEKSKSSPPKNNSTNIVSKKNPKRNEKRNASGKTPISFAQMLTNGNEKVTKIPASPTGAVSVNTNDKIPAKDTDKSPKLNEVQSNTTAEKSTVQEEWQTVKAKGKRRHFKDSALISEFEEKASDKVEELEEIAEPIVEDVKKITECPVVELVEENPVQVNTTKSSSSIEVSEESMPQADPVIDNDVKPGSLSNSEKKNRSRNKKQKKCPNSGKKIKEGEIVKESGSKSSGKATEKHKNNSRPIEVKDANKAKKALFISSGSSEEDLTLESLYLLDSKNYLLTKNYCRNPLELLNGFDCKFKGNSAILKEEEEMVLNVIKSLSTNQSKQLEVKSPCQDGSSEIPSGIHSDKVEDSTPKEIVHVPDRETTEATNDIQQNLNENVFNGNGSDCDSEVDKNSNQVEDIVHTAVQVDSVSEKIPGADPHTESFAQNEVEESEVIVEVSDIVELKLNCLNTLEQSQENYQNEICLDMTDVRSEKLDARFSDEVPELQYSTEIAEALCAVPNDSHLDGDGSGKNENSADPNCEIAFTATLDYSASLLRDTNEINASNSSSSEHALSDQSDTDSFHIDLFKYKPKSSPEEKLNIKEIFEAKMKEIEDELSKSDGSCTSKEIVVEQNLPDNSVPVDPCTLPINDINGEISYNTIPVEEKSPIKNMNEICENCLEAASENVPSIGQSILVAGTNSVETLDSDSVGEIYVESNLHENKTPLEKSDLEETLLIDDVLEPIEEPLKKSTIVCETFEERNVANNEDSNCIDICSNTLQSESSTLVVNLVTNEESGESDDQNSSCVSPISSARVNTSFTTITSEEGRSFNDDSGHLDDNSTSDYHSSNEIHDSKETFKKDNNSDETEYSSTFILTDSPDSSDDSNKYPLTMAVKQWLINEAKEKTPEPIFRIPDDPKLNTMITSSIIEQVERNKECDSWTSEESDDEDVVKRPKNLQSNPSHVSSANFLLKRDQINQQHDTDSDYNSDSQQRYDDDDNTCERVATNISDISSRNKCDHLLEDYWDDEFVRDPKKWLDANRRTSEENESIFSSTPSEQLAPYDSVYGKSIDYNRLLANNYEFLSNNIISFNGTSPDEKPHANVDEITSGTMLNNNFGNVSSKNTCMKPLEVCCIIM